MRLGGVGVRLASKGRGGECSSCVLACVSWAWVFPPSASPPAARCVGGTAGGDPTDRPTDPPTRVGREEERARRTDPLSSTHSPSPPPTRLQMCYVCPFSTFSSPSLPLAMPLSIIEDCTGFSKRGIAFEREMWMYSFKQTFFPKLLIFDISSAC